MTGRGPLAALGFGACVTLAVACSAGRRYSAKSEQVQPRADLMADRPDAIRARITELSAQIDQERGQLGDEPPGPEAMSAMTDVTPEAAAATCERSARELCSDVCKLGDSICTNAQSICDLAGQLPGDAWAAERCTAGKASCKSASEKCCAC